MNRFICLTILVAFVSAASQDKAPNFTINLDLAPEDRFKEVALHFREQFKNSTLTFMPFIPKPVKHFFDSFSWVWYYVHRERYLELKGFAEAAAIDEIPLSRAILINTFFTMQSWCTSVVAQMKNGTLIHQRNLDFANAQSMMQLVFQADFQRAGKTVFSATMFAGSVGVYTGVRKDSFSISIN